MIPRSSQTHHSNLFLMDDIGTLVLSQQQPD